MSNNRRGSSRGRNQRYNEHDNRTVHFGPQRSRGGSFKSRPPKKTGFYTKRNVRPFTPRSRLNDEDVDMNDGAASAGSSDRFSPYRDSRNNSRYGRSSRGRAVVGDKDQIMKSLGAISRDTLGKSDWYKVTIPHGKKTEKSVILKSLAELMNNVPFVPFHYMHDGQNAVFYVNDQSTAQSIRNCSKQITTPTGFKLLILVRASPPPYVQMTSEVVEKLKVVMSNRYDPANRSLNMSSLHEDDSLKQEGIHLTLNKYTVMKEVLSIIESNIPEIVSLDLSNNRIYTLDALLHMHEKTPNLIKISVGHNQLKSEHDLDALMKLQIEELMLDGNPLCDKFKDEVSYVSALRKKFPKLTMLDGHELPPVIKVDLESGCIPPTKGSNFGNEQVKPIVCRFCEEYFTIYDTNDRQPLLNAYHDQALFTLSVNYNPLANDKRDHSQANFKDYLNDSRNLMKITYADRRQKMLKHGKLAVVAALNQLPATQHDPASYVVDVSHVSASMLVFTVTGLFKERESKMPRRPVRYFSRTFVAVPQGSGIVITNDLYTISNASPSQLKKAFQSPPLAASSPVTTPVAGTSGTNPASPIPTPAAAGSSEEMRSQMVAQFSQQSGMNREWSQKCLEQNAWDYDKSAAIFADLQSQGKIPPEAFVK